MSDLSIKTDHVQKVLKSFIQKEVHGAGFQRVVVGISGGIDSAVACYLAADALGAENVLAIRLPYRTSSADSLEDAQKVVDATGVQSLTIPITELVDPLINRFPEMNGLRRGNIMARTRMIILFDQSAAFNGLVMGTDNKTEALLGYTTVHGDAACAFNPLGDLYKTQIRQLGKALGIPESIQIKPPSADLWEGQTDESELGFTYAEVDPLLHLLVEQHATPGECIQAGYTREFVEMIIQRVHRNRFKRLLPKVASISGGPVN